MPLHMNGLQENRATFRFKRSMGVHNPDLVSRACQSRLNPPRGYDGEFTAGTDLGYERRYLRDETEQA